MTVHENFQFGDADVSVVVTQPPWYENCYIVSHRPTGSRVVIDPGGDAEAIRDAVSRLGGGVAAIWLTHGHPDHIGAARDLQAALGVPCLAHADERPIIEAAAEMAAALMGADFELPECDYFVGEPELDFGGGKVGVLHTPGHTPGGVCYVFDGFVVTGDTLFNHGVGRTDLPGGDGRLLVASIGRLLQRLPEGHAIFSGHGPAWEVGEARRWWRQMGALV